MRELVIDRQIWFRGRGHEDSRLLLPSPYAPQMCCVGIYLKACGVPDEALLNKKTVHELDEGGLPDEVQWLLDRGDPATVSYDLYNLNDQIGPTAEAREQAIAARFAEHGVHVTFIN